MDQRAWVVVGLFGGVVAMVVAWVALSSSDDAGAGASRPRTPMVKERKLMKATPSVREMDVARLRNSPSLRRIAPPDGSDPQPSSSPRPISGDGPFPLDQEGLSAAVGSRQGDLSACFLGARVHTPALASAVTLVLQVAPAEGAKVGSLASVEVLSEPASPVLSSCATGALAGLTFIAEEPATVRFPTDLAPRPPAGATAGP